MKPYSKKLWLRKCYSYLEIVYFTFKDSFVCVCVCVCVCVVYTYVFCNILQENLKELFGQTNIFVN